jgi:uncharacterized protein
LVTLGVTHLERATRFYAEGLGLPRLKSPPTVSFFEVGGTWFALYPKICSPGTVGVRGEAGQQRPFPKRGNERRMKRA